eukprot:11118348-Karenia_brevis.AAC.1
MSRSVVSQINFCAEACKDVKMAVFSIFIATGPRYAFSPSMACSAKEFKWLYNVLIVQRSLNVACQARATSRATEVAVGMKESIIESTSLWKPISDLIAPSTVQAFASWRM